jgi:hypothetical protein
MAGRGQETQLEIRELLNMSAAKIIAIVVLLLVGFHLLLYGYIKRRIAAAKAQKDIEA